MKNKYFLTGILLLVVLLTACGSTAAGLPEQVSGAEGASQGDASPGTEGQAQGVSGEEGSTGQQESPVGGPPPAGQAEGEPGFNREIPQAMRLKLPYFQGALPVCRLLFYSYS